MTDGKSFQYVRNVAAFSCCAKDSIFLVDTQNSLLLFLLLLNMFRRVTLQPKLVFKGPSAYVHTYKIVKNLKNLFTTDIQRKIKNKLNTYIISSQIKLYTIYKPVLKLVMVRADFISVERLLHSFAPRNENPFWPLAVCRFGI